jgi:hypothetical protein
MEFTLGHPRDIRPGTGPAGPPYERAMGMPGTVTAPRHGTQAVVPRPLAATRHTASLTGLPHYVVLMRRAPLLVCWEERPHAG